MIPLEAIDHIEITKGGNSVLYGDGATSGTINIVTKRNTGNLSVATAGVGSYAGLQGSLYHAQDFGIHQLSLFAKTDSTNGYRQNSRTTEESAGLNWATNFNANDRIALRILTNKEMDHLPGALPLIYLNTSPQNSEVPGYQNSLNTNTNSVVLFGQKRLGNVELALDLSQRIKNANWAYRYNAQSVYSGYTAPNPFSNGQESTLNTTQNANPRIKINDFLFTNNHLILGYDWNKTERILNGFLTFSTTSSGPSAFNAGFRSEGWYARDDWQITTSDRVTAGVRVQTYTEQNATYSWNSSGRTTAHELQYTRNLGQLAVAYVRTSQNFRLPNIDDNNASAYYNPQTFATIPLVHQVSHDIDLGITTRIWNLTNEIKYFRSDVTHEIGYDPNLGNINFDPTRRAGVELKELLKLNQRWEAKLNLQVIRATFASGQYSGNTIPDTSNVNGNVGLDYSLDQHQQLGFTERFSSNRISSGDYLNNQAKVPGYWVTDLTYGYREKSWSVVASINNIFDQHYADVGIYKPSYTIPYNLSTYPNPGRNFSLLGRYSF
jgi:iron complex outermembrane receptor protein